jgi:23S rRNA pseudouridine1911/1915/1917 synthase
VKSRTITDSDAKERLDIYAIAQQPLLSRAFIQKLIVESKIKVNNKAQKPSYKLKINDRVSIDFDMKELELIPNIELPVIYEDKDCIVIDKPVGLLAHSKGVFNPEATVATWLQKRIHADDHVNQHNQRMGIVHRLDRGTSGVMIVAKNSQALAWLQKQFAARKVKKTYMAVVDGKLHLNEAIIDMPIERNPKSPKSFRVGVNGKPSKTEYKVIKVASLPGKGKVHNDQIMSLIELKPETGRTHQLRVHLKQIGHPIVGDPVYGGKPFERMLLHANSLELTLPNHERHVFRASIPIVFETYMKAQL